MRPLDEWDADYLDELIPRDETTNFEKKASEGFVKEKIAQGVCALANSGGGFMAFGYKDEKAGNGLDAGVLSMKGRQLMKDWVEALIPKLHQPPITGCEARFIQHDSHTTDRGVLVIAVPLSERRPHWVKENDIPYLRVGAHSPPMPTQVFVDMLTRGSVPTVEIVDLGLSFDGSSENSSGRPATDFFTFKMAPLICLNSGPACEIWGCEILEPSKLVGFQTRGYKESDFVDMPRDNRPVFIRGREPLFPGRHTPLISQDIDLQLLVPRYLRDNFEVVLRLFAASAPPIERQFGFAMKAGRLYLPVPSD